MAVWGIGSAALFLWASRRMGAPWWLVLFPVLWLVAVCGQTTFMIGGLVMAALALPGRPRLAGVLFGLAMALKPQMLLFLPLALIAEARWRTFIWTGAVGFLVCAGSALAWGVGSWFDWLDAVRRFQQDVLGTTPQLVEDSITPYAALERLGLPGAAASYLLGPVGAWLVWTTFRRTEEIADRIIALFAAGLMVSPYAMHYDSAVLAPAVAVYMARTQARPWLLNATAATLFAMGMIWGPTTLAAALSLPLIAWLSDRQAQPATA
jgi:hypothetical protein